MEKKVKSFPVVEVIKFDESVIVTSSDDCDEFDGYDCGNTDGYYCCQGDIHS